MAALAATTSPLIRHYTLEEFWTLDNPPDGGHYELIAGLLYMVPPPDGPHTITVSRLIRLFSSYLTAHADLGELFVPRAAIWTSARTYLEPDLMFVSAERLRRTDPGRLTAADLVVEIISPSTAVYDRTTKADTYAALGVGELWLVDTGRQTIEQRVLGDEGWERTTVYPTSETIEAVWLPGFTCAVSAVFA
jgi:Uma2 family endonuclease